MKRRLVRTADGSSTIYVESLNEHYHSVHGAIRESRHIFINAALEWHSGPAIRILEYGMGTGLNMLLTYYAVSKTGRKVHYHTIEKYPLEKSEVSKLNYYQDKSLDPEGVFQKIHELPWGIIHELHSGFSIFKEKADFRYTQAKGPFDIIYFDAFAPDVQPELWSYDIFSRIAKNASEGAVLTTYSAKGQLKRDLQKAGFKVEKLPGPPGKREFIRAIKL